METSLLFCLENYYVIIVLTVVMAELVDALVSEASEETHGGSSPLGHTITVELVQYKVLDLFIHFIFIIC